MVTSSRWINLSLSLQFRSLSWGCKFRNHEHTVFTAVRLDIVEKSKENNLRTEVLVKSSIKGQAKQRE